MDRWTKLTRASQFRIAHYVARRQGLRLQKAFPNVVSVGVGLRSRGDAKTIVDEICLRFLVSRKWKARRKQSTSIPQHVHTYARVGHKTVRISIPTDVSEFRGGAPHANLDLTEGIESRQSGNPVENGSCCCLVRNASSSGERYLLSCYHVFSPSLNGTPGDIDCVASANQNTIGH